MSRKTVELPRRIIDYYAQTGFIRKKFPQFRPVTWRGHKAWRGKLQPDPGSRAYDVAIVYRGPKAPRVYVVSPKLGRAKHLYREGYLCLFDPKDPGRRWERDAIVAETTIPWTAGWLHFHELFLETGYWLGPETIHRSRKDSEALQ